MQALTYNLVTGLILMRISKCCQFINGFLGFKESAVLELYET